MFPLSIPIKRTDPRATLPTRATPHDAGYDLYSLSYGSLAPGHRMLVSTGISLAIPEGYYGRVAPRSGLAAKSGLDVLAGVVDSGYRAEVKVVLINLGSAPYLVEEGARIAQLIIEKCHSVDWQEVAELDDTARSQGGFGSTGS